MKKKKIIIIVLSIVIVFGLATSIFLIINNNKKNKIKHVTVYSKKVNSALKIKDNNLNDFDLYFMKLENNNKNMLYSPLSIKYTLFYYL